MKRVGKSKKAKLIIGAIILVVLICAIFGKVEDPEPANDQTGTEQTQNNGSETTVKNTIKDAYVGEDHEDYQVDIFGEPIGISNKSFGADCDVDVLLSDVNDDATGNWKLLKIAEDIDICEYALDLFGNYAPDDDTIIFVVNFTNNTTTCINYLSGSLYVDTFEYVDKEEHSAKTLGSGMQLGEWIISAESGRIYENDVN